MSQVEMVPQARRQLTPPQEFALLAHIQAEYHKSGLTDVEFAAQATLALGFQVEYAHVRSLRCDFNIENKRSLIKAATSESQLERICVLEKKVSDLQKRIIDTTARIDTYFGIAK